MQFQSYYYVFLFIPTVFVIYSCSRKNIIRNILIIGSSYIFYAWGNPYLALLLISSSIVDYFIGRKLRDLNSKIEINRNHIEMKNIKNYKYLFLLLSLFFNIGLLFFFKYWDWFIGLTSAFLLKNNYLIFGETLLELKHGITVPPGISFYTFQTLSYTIDNFRGQFNKRVSFIDYLAFVAFFPQLIAGPIERANDLLPQLYKFRKNIDFETIEKSIFLISWGIFKKVVFADNLGNLVQRSLENIESPGIGIILLIAFSFQIYCDFSAYTDIARGSAKLFGINLKRNFLTPYFALNPSDFWKRWHISLSNWVRDYIYIPLGGNRGSNISNTKNIILTMAIMGLWHGARKFFIIWGIYHGLLIILYRICAIDKYLIESLGKIKGKIIAIFIMYSFTLFGWLLFFSRNNQEFISIFKSVISVLFINSISSEANTTFITISYGLLIYCLPVLISELVGYLYSKEFVEIANSLNTFSKSILYIFIIYGLLIFGSRGSYDFIYFQF